MDLDATIGSLFIGYTVSLCLYGITLSQIGLFFRSRRRKSKYLKAIAWFLFVFENAQTVAISDGLWLYLVSYRTNPSSLAIPSRSFGILVYLTSTNNLFVRCVYAYRVYKLSGRYILLPLTVVALSATVASLAIVYGTQGVKMVPWAEGREFAPIFYAGYACELAADLIITGSITYVFSQRSMRSNGVTQKLLAYVVNSGLLVMICVICSVIAYVAIPQSFAFIAFYLALGKLYANSLLGALNARDVIFPRSRTHKTEPPTVPILTSVVVMDCNDSMLETTVDQGQDERTSGSYNSEETRVAAAFGARSSGLTGSEEGLCHMVSEAMLVAETQQTVHFDR